ncbi:MAG: EAL domain-containing protein [Pseudomonadales bacterium]|nr:EAL domain-containing protein [Pseudomonadales bacterium]
MNHNDTIRLLVINDSDSEVERLLSMLSNAGRNTRAQHVPSEEGLEKLLNEQAWDLLIAMDSATTVDPKAAIRVIKKLDKDVPAIFQTEAMEEERQIALIEGLKAGARDVVTLDDDQHLLLVMDRELSNLTERRQRRTADRRFNDSERRCQHLLESSRDAIAYVDDGMFLFNNLSFAMCFGYEDPDDVLCIPVIDMICEEDHETYKNFVKDMETSDEIGAKMLSVRGIKQDGTEFDITIAVSPATYDEEPCQQFRIDGAELASYTAATGGQQQGAAPAGVSSTTDPVTGLNNRRYILDAVGSAVQDAAENDKYRSLFYIAVDRFETIRAQVGVSHMDGMLANLASAIDSNKGEKAVIGRFGDDEFLMLVPGIDSEQTVKRAKELCKAIEDHICEAGGKTIQTTISIGIAPISDNATNPDDIINKAHTALLELREESKIEDVGNGARLYVPKVEEGNANDDAIQEVARHAIDNNELKLLFQPVVSLQGSDYGHYEVRTELPGESKSVSDHAIFNAVSRNKEIAKKFDRYVILEAIKALAEHQKKGHQTRLFINLTNTSIQDEAIAGWIGVAIKAAGLDHDNFIFQFNENDANSYLKQTMAISKDLKELGCHTSIKGFGCALDPFKSLAHFGDVEIVKIDASFTTDIQSKGESPEKLKEIAAKLKEAGKITIISHVESASILPTLWQTGVDFIQGRYLQAPSPEMNYEFDEA